MSGMRKKTTKPTLKKVRRNWKTPFLTALRTSPDVSRAAKAAHVDRSYVYTARQVDVSFAAAWEDAINQALDAAEGELYRRGVLGIQKPVTIAGKRELVVEHSDTLLIFLLKAHRPERYRERLEVTTWRDKVIAALRSGRLDPQAVKDDLGYDLATELFIAAGILFGEGGKAPAAIEEPPGDGE